MFCRPLCSKTAFLIAASILVGLAAHADSPDWRSKVDPWVLDQTRSASVQTEFLIVLASQADVSRAASLATKEAKGRFVFETLSAHAARTQGPVLAELVRRALPHRAYWVTNMVWAKGKQADVQALAERGDVSRISANPSVRLDATALETRFDLARVPAAVEPGVTKVGAPIFWAQGFTGQDIVVAGEDTGYDWDHPALKSQYRGWDGAVADHNFNWHDAIHSGGGVCGANAVAPCDDGTHGTHTMGTMVGDDGLNNQIGVAPGARWIGCRNMNQGFGTPTTYAECFQFFIAPTDLSDSNANPALAPHVINNSWGCPPAEGCTDPTVLQTVVENVRSAGIVVVVSAGNAGGGCSSVEDPPAIYDASFSVGATNINDTIAGFSSRGPVTIDGSNRMKPDISAPGVNVRSSVPGTGYGLKDGTSMAGPHVAGVVAVLLSAAPGLMGDQDAVEQCLIAMAVALTSGQTCGGVPGSSIPNNTFGHGRVELVWPLDTACEVNQVFSDGFETGDTSAWSLVVP